MKTKQIYFIFKCIICERKKKERNNISKTNKILFKTKYTIFCIDVDYHHDDPERYPVVEAAVLHRDGHH